MPVRWYAVREHASTFARGTRSRASVRVHGTSATSRVLPFTLHPSFAPHRAARRPRDLPQAPVPALPGERRGVVAGRVWLRRGVAEAGMVADAQALSLYLAVADPLLCAVRAARVLHRARRLWQHRVRAVRRLSCARGWRTMSSCMEHCMGDPRRERMHVRVRVLCVVSMTYDMPCWVWDMCSRAGRTELKWLCPSYDAELAPHTTTEQMTAVQMTRACSLMVARRRVRYRAGDAVAHSLCCASAASGCHYLGTCALRGTWRVEFA